MASCGFVEKQIDKTVDGPNPPADTTVTLVLDEKEEEPPEPPSIMPPPSGPLKITTTDAVLLSLTNNRSLIVEKLNPSITRTFEETERAVFDPNLEAEISGGRTDAERQARAGSLTEDYAENEGVGVISLSQYFPTGTTVILEGSAEMDDSSLYQDAFYWSRLGLTVNQAILRGYGSDVNLVRLRQARLETRMSEFELRGFTLALVAQVEETFWDYAPGQTPGGDLRGIPEGGPSAGGRNPGAHRGGPIGQIGTAGCSGGDGGTGTGTHQRAERAGNPAVAALAPAQSDGEGSVAAGSGFGLSADPTRRETG